MQRNVNIEYGNPWVYNFTDLLGESNLFCRETVGVAETLINTEVSWGDDEHISVEAWLSLYQLFRDKFNKKRNLFVNAAPEQVEVDFKGSAERIFDLNPDVVSVDVTDDECVFMYAEFGTKHIFYNIFYDEDGREIQLNLIDNNKPVASISGDMNSSLAELEKFISGHFGDDSYAISGTPTTQIYI